jgi:hypothetical protein
MEENQIILNQIRTPDGTILKSMHVHDYVTHVDKNGHVYMVDGGSEYLRRNVNRTKLNKLQKIWIKLKSFFGITWTDPLAYTELSIYSNAPFEVIRENFHRGGRGKDGRQPLTWVPMSQMSDEWLKACITYNQDRGMGGCFANKMYAKELQYRLEKGISIPE